MREPFIQVDTQAGDPIEVHGLQIIPMAKAARVQPPGLSAGLVWNRPSAVVVQNSAGEQQVLPVEDPTRKIQLTLLGAGLLGSLLIWLALRQHPSA